MHNISIITNNYQWSNPKSQFRFSFKQKNPKVVSKGVSPPPLSHVLWMTGLQAASLLFPLLNITCSDKTFSWKEWPKNVHRSEWHLSFPVLQSLGCPCHCVGQRLGIRCYVSFIATMTNPISCSAPAIGNCRSKYWDRKFSSHACFSFEVSPCALHGWGPETGYGNRITSHYAAILIGSRQLQQLGSN